jgi:hypothetical protein
MFVYKYTEDKQFYCLLNVRIKRLGTFKYTTAKHSICHDIFSFYTIIALLVNNNAIMRDTFAEGNISSSLNKQYLLARLNLEISRQIPSFSLISKDVTIEVQII